MDDELDEPHGPGEEVRHLRPADGAVGVERAVVVSQHHGPLSEGFGGGRVWLVAVDVGEGRRRRLRGGRGGWRRVRDRGRQSGCESRNRTGDDQRHQGTG